GDERVLAVGGQRRPREATPIIRATRVVGAGWLADEVSDAGERAVGIHVRDAAERRAEGDGIREIVVVVAIPAGRREHVSVRRQGVANGAVVRGGEGGPCRVLGARVRYHLARITA